MWEQLDSIFQRAEKSLGVVKLMLEHGLRLNSQGEIYCGRIKLSYTALARACGSDRRTVKQAISKILSNPKLAELFSNLEPAGAALKNVARLLNYKCIIVEPTQDRPGIIAEVTKLVALHGLNIIQLIAEDPKLHPNPKLYMILENPPPPELITGILAIPGIKSVSIQ